MAGLWGAVRAAADRLMGMPALDPAIAQLPIEAAHFVVLDTELTGLDPAADELLSVGAIRMTGSRILLGQTLYRTIRPRRAQWPKTVPIHRIFPGDVAEAATSSDALRDLAQFARDALLVGHFVAIDRRFLTAAAADPNAVLNDRLWLDNRRLAEWLERSRRGDASGAVSNGAFGLESLAGRYQVPVPAAHHALVDAFVTARIWQRLLHEAVGYGVRTIGDLARVAAV